MITIQNIQLLPNTTTQTIELRGLRKVLDLHVDENNIPYVSVIVNTAEHINRTAVLNLLTAGSNCICLLQSPKYLGSKGGYYLFLKEIRPKPR